MSSTAHFYFINIFLNCKEAIDFVICIHSLFIKTATNVNICKI